MMPVRRLPSTWGALGPIWREPYWPVLKPIAALMNWLARMTQIQNEQYANGSDVEDWPVAGEKQR
ncbi:MAG: hypothetical protein ABSA57_08545 [Candidatus Acidiferrales bacterium]|jgi:hypothetical protein